MLVIERPAGGTTRDEQPERLPPAPSSNRMGPVLAMVAGLVLVGAALAVVTRVPQASPQAAPAPASSALTLAGPADVTVQAATYEPGHSSGWHAHTGMHAVTVLSGTVTFYDSQCQGRTYGPGETYIGGQDVHVARNDTVLPVEMSVTYLFPAGRPHTTFHVASPAPAGCPVS